MPAACPHMHEATCPLTLRGNMSRDLEMQQSRIAMCVQRLLLYGHLSCQGIYRFSLDAGCAGDHTHSSCQPLIRSIYPTEAHSCMSFSHLDWVASGCELQFGAQSVCSQMYVTQSCLVADACV